MPFCQKCGAEVEPGDLYCGSCGSKIVESSGKPSIPFDTSSIAKGLKGIASRAREQTTVIKSEIDERLQSKDILKSAEGALSSIRDRVKTSGEYVADISGVEPFSKVLAWVMKTHVEALTLLTEEIVPHMKSHNCIDGTSLRLDWGMECPATVKNILMALPHVEIGLKNLADLAKVREDISLSVEEARRLKERLEGTLEAYLSTKDALKTLYKASNPIDRYLTDIGDISRKDDVTNVRKLAKYEKAADNFSKNVRNMEWDRFPQVDPSPWIEESLQYSMNVISMEVETSYHHVLYQYPYISPLAYSTDIERYLVPHFLFISAIDGAYARCKGLFEKCKSESGLLRSPDQRLREETIEALSAFNTQYHGVYSAYSYSYRTELRLQKNGDIVSDCERILKKIDQSLRGASSGISVKNAKEIIHLIYKLVILLNEVEAVLKSRAERPW